MKNPFRYGLEHALLSFILFLLTNRFSGFMLIFGSIHLFGKPYLISWDFVFQALMINIGVSIIVRAEKKDMKKE